MPTYEPVQAWELEKCKGPRHGTSAFRDVCEFLWHGSGEGDDGIYNRRLQRGGNQWSLHAVGRAWDFHQSEEGVGNLIAAALVARRTPIEGCGIIEVIWWDRCWYDDGKGWRAYHPGPGGDPHHGHIHIGQSIAAADNPATTDALHGWYAACLTATS